jgi:alpha-1,2-mannosyltransferase
MSSRESARSPANSASPWPYWAAAVAGIALVAYLAAWGHRYGLDLRVYRQSARAWLDGHNPYFSTFTRSQLAYTYPPFALLVLASLTWASFAVTQCLMWVVSVLAATAAVVFILKDRGFAGRAPLWFGAFAWACASMILLEPARSSVDYGQIEFVLMFLVVADVLVVPSSYRGIGIGIAAAIKLTPLIFVLVLFVRRDWHSVVRAVLSFMVWTGFTWLLWPELSRVYWDHDVIHPARVGTVTNGSNQSWYAVLHRPPFPESGSAPAWLVLSLASVLLGTFVAWRCVRTERQSFAIISVALAGLLISPISWTHHWIWVLLIPPMLVGPLRHETKSVVRVMLWALVGLTVVAPYWWFSTGAPADAFQALVPIWTFALLVVWSTVEFMGWRRDPRHSERLAIKQGTVPEALCPQPVEESHHSG